MNPVEAQAVDPDAIRGAALRSSRVVALSGGTYGEAATYGPGSRTVGVQVRDDSIVVHVVARWGSDASELARDVRRLVVPKAAGRRVDVVLADVAGPHESTESTPPAARPPASP